MCLQYQKRAFYNDDPTTTTGKASAAASKVSSFEGGPAGHGNRLGASCVKVEADRAGSSASAIPHCAALSQLCPELRQVAGVVECSFARSFLHHFTATPGVGVFRGGDIAQAGCGRDTVRELASVGGRKAFVYWGRHQSRAIGDPEALESAVRGDLELYKACTNGEVVTDMRVGEMMLDILMKAIEIHAEANGGPTENDIRRCHELEEARDQGLPQILKVTGRVGKEVRGKHVRTRDDCRAGGEASIRKRKEDPQKFKEDCSTGGAAKYTAEQRGADMSTVELKAQGGANGDRAKKAVGGGMSSGNRAGSEVPYAGVLIDVPDVELLCAKCKRTGGNSQGPRATREGASTRRRGWC